MFRKFVGILNKLTPQKFETLAGQALQMPIDSEERLKGCVDRIFNAVCNSVCLSVFVSVYLSVRVRVCMYVCLCVYVCMYVCMYVFTYVHMYVPGTSACIHMNE